VFFYMHAPTSRWGTWRLDHLVLSDQLWSPGGNVDSLIADYCARAYPDAPREMVAFYAAVETASANILALEGSIGALGSGAPQGRLSVRAWPLFPLRHLQLLPSSAAHGAPSWTEIVAAMHTARVALDRARAAAREPGERWRLEEDARRFAYGELTFGLYDQLYRLGRADRGETGIDTREALQAADSLAAGLRAIHDLVQVAGAHANAKDGLDASHVAPALDYFHSRFGHAGR
jgi:hypothetical protein